MVGNLKPGLLVMLLAGGLALCVEAADLADPTRPPPEFAAAPTDAADAGALRLQSIVLPRSGRPRAVINGQVVALGEKLGEATLVKVSEGGVVLRGPLGVERLALTPEASKTPGTKQAVNKAGDKKERP